MKADSKRVRYWWAEGWGCIGLAAVGYDGKGCPTTLAHSGIYWTWL